MDWLILHLAACLLLLIFSVILYLLPLQGVLKNSAVENIRELGE